VRRLELVRAETEPLAFHETLALAADIGGEDVISPGTVELAGVVEKAGSGFSLTATVRGECKLRCARCLKGFPFDFADDVYVRLLPLAEAPQDEETRLHGPDLEVRYYEAAEVDLEELALEQQQLALPMKPLCRPDCAGLCPRCGADLNLGRCACPAQRDDRWTPLVAWRQGK
jgi:DUF177 domain-containing protein